MFSLELREKANENLEYNKYFFYETSQAVCSLF